MNEEFPVSASHKLTLITSINDLPDSVQSYCKIFADDTKVYNSVYNKDVLQQDLNNLKKWTEKWCLYFNVLKCKVLHTGSNNENREYVLSSENDNRAAVSGYWFDKAVEIGEQSPDLMLLRTPYH